MNLRDRLVFALTEWDRKESVKRHHNPYALGIYLARAEQIESDIASGADPAQAVAAGFSGPLLRFLQKRLALAGLPESANVFYNPVSKKG